MKKYLPRHSDEKQQEEYREKWEKINEQINEINSSSKNLPKRAFYIQEILKNIEISGPPDEEEKKEASHTTSSVNPLSHSSKNNIGDIGYTGSKTDDNDVDVHEKGNDNIQISKKRKNS